MPRRLMPRVALVMRRQRRRAAQRRSPAQRLLRALVAVLGGLSLAAAVLALAAWPFYQWLAASTPPVSRLAFLLAPEVGELLQPTEIYDRTGAWLWTSLAPPDAPRRFGGPQNPQLAAAFVASQQPDYWQAAANPLWPLDNGPQGIAERLVARVLLADEPDGWLKTLQARLLAKQALQTYGPQQVLTWALDSADFGHWAFGQQSAAQLYFGMPASQLSLGQTALLAAVAQAPALNPFDAPELARAYQRLVLTSLRDQGQISEQDYAQAFSEDLGLLPQPAGPSAPSGFEVLLLTQLQAELGQARLQLGGLTVTSTLDRDLQAELEAGGLAEHEAIVLDPLNGQVLAYVGAGNPQPADDLLPPFYYLEVFALGYAPASLVWDLPAEDNFVPGDYLGPTNLRAALAGGLTRPVQPLLDQFGPTRAADGLAAFGWLPGQPASALDVAQAYAVLAARGLRAGQGHDSAALQASTLLFAADTQNRVLLNWTVLQFSSVTSPELAFLVSDVLADASLRAAGGPESSRPLAFYAGAGWQVAYSPQRVLVTGAAVAPAQFSQAYAAAHAALPLRTWEVPAGLTTVTVCVPSGLLPGPACPQQRSEFFLAGSAPTQGDTLYERIALNSLNGRRATVFTPLEFVREQTFLRAPEQARAWATAAGLAQPPQDYDTLALPVATDASRITSPQPFAVLRGTANLNARLAAGAAFYEIQVGQGLWPQEWVSLAQGSRPASGQVRASWDTTGLFGVWVVQLQTWGQDDVLQRSYLAVTLEN